MDILYVIYFDNKIYRNTLRNAVYFDKEYAELVFKEEIFEIAVDMASNDNKHFVNLNTGERQEYIEKAKSRFEIREFVERKD